MSEETPVPPFGAAPSGNEKQGDKPPFINVPPFGAAPSGNEKQGDKPPFVNVPPFVSGMPPVVSGMPPFMMPPFVNGIPNNAVKVELMGWSGVRFLIQWGLFCGTLVFSIRMGWELANVVLNLFNK